MQERDLGVGTGKSGDDTQREFGSRSWWRQPIQSLQTSFLGMPCVEAVVDKVRSRKRDRLAEADADRLLEGYIGGEISITDLAAQVKTLANDPNVSPVFMHRILKGVLARSRGIK